MVFSKGSKGSGSRGQPDRIRQRRRRPLRKELSFGWNLVLNLATGLFAFLCLVPFLFTIIISFTDEYTLGYNGYAFIPAKLSTSAYQYVVKVGDQLIQSYLVSITITVVGTVLGLTMTALYAYCLSRQEFKYRRFFTFFAFFTMLFSGGLIPLYVVCTKLLHLHNTIGALILPLALNPFFIIVMRTFFNTTIPDSVIESARIDGAGEFTIFSRIVLPVSLPGLATIGLFISLGYWNDWFNALLFITKASLTPVQYLLIRIEKNMEFVIQNAAIMQTVQGKQILQSLPRESSRMAMVVLATLPIVMAYPFFQRYFVRGLTIGSVKG